MQFRCYNIYNVDHVGDKSLLGKQTSVVTIMIHNWQECVWMRNGNLDMEMRLI